MKNIPYNEDYPLQRVEKGDAVEISVMHKKRRQWLRIN